jgi:AcrR family transcriptional regulator
MNQFQKIQEDHGKHLGLRERNREERHRRILESAARQFRERGYDHVKIEEIAEAAGVSVGTIYNYYKNKGDVLVAIVSLEVNEVLVLGEAVVASPPKNAVKAVERLILTYIDHSLTYLSKEMWRQAMAISTMQPTSPAGDTYAGLDVALKRQTGRLIDKLIAMKIVDSKTDARSIGEMIFHGQNDMFINFVKDDSQSLDDLKVQLRRNLGAVVGLIATGRETVKSGFKKKAERTTT